MYGCCGRSNTSTAFALLHDLARVHDADPVAQRADDAEVVGDEQDRGVRLGAQLADEVEDARLDRRIETGRRLVEHEQLRIGGEGHGDDDALLHPARELVRVALDDPDRVGDLDTVAGRPCAFFWASSWLWPRTVNASTTWGPTSVARIEGAARVLVDHRGVVHPELADLVVAHLRDVVAGDEDPAAGDPPVARQVAHRGVGGRRLAAAGLADEAVRLARRDLERHAAQHRPRDAADDVGERQVLDLERARSCRARGRRRPGSVAVIRTAPIAGRRR